MATDNAVMRYKDIKYYNEKLQASMPSSGGGVSSLADLGITLSADTINGLPTAISNAQNEAISAANVMDENYRTLYSDITFTFSKTAVSLNICTYISSSITLLGGVCYNNSVNVLPVKYAYYASSDKWYIYVKTDETLYGDVTLYFRTFYRNNA